MNIIGHLIALLGLYGLYSGWIFLGCLGFLVGGVLAGKLFFCLRSGGVLAMVTSVAYGYHNEYTATVIFIIFIGAVFACFNSKRVAQTNDNGWGFSFDISSGSGSDSGGGGDCGGGGGE